ncbi:MAG: D-2-hydroxyacid dehydrogenase [Thermoguttaceae bacterium]|nr:D-2-hydroxyacid dehydrogenase [Thermoguttaceae bacterium]
MMKIVVLDGYTLNPGDLDWEPLARFGELAVYDRTRPEEVYDRIAKAQVVFTNKVILDKTMIDRLDQIKFIGVLATGYNVVDLSAAKARGIMVSNIPAYGTDSVAQWTFAHLLNLASRIAESSGAVRAGQWTTSPDFSFWRGPLIELTGKTFGLVGFGAIGRRVATIAAAFGMRVVGYSRHLQPGQVIHGVSSVDLDTLLKTSDVVSLHCPLNENSRGMINAAALAKMKPGAFLINTGRGPLIDEQAVADALESGQLGGFGADVLSTEPPLADNPLLSAKNCYLTPHNAWATREARQRLLNTASQNLESFISGSPRNIVNGLN